MNESSLHYVCHSLGLFSPCFRKCGASSFSKAGMINEKKVTLAGQDLSLRGNEESRLGNYDSQINLDIN